MPPVCLTPVGRLSMTTWFLMTVYTLNELASLGQPLLQITSAVLPCPAAAVLQMEPVLNRTKAELLVASTAKAGEVAAVQDTVFSFLDMAVQAKLGSILNDMVEVSLQREDLGR